MCLGTKLSDSSLRRYKASGKRFGYIRIWKVVEDSGKRFVPEFAGRQHKNLYGNGLAKARKDATEEQELIHAFRDRESAEEWADSTQAIISALVRPAWVMAIGETRSPELTLTCKALVMPVYPKRRTTVAEFRAAIKGKKVQKYSWE